MGMQWALRDEADHDDKAIIEALQKGWEPFAVYKGRIWFKAQFFNEDTEEKSSAKTAEV